jgi:uncharacterized protein YqcC (DUF446 family)
VNCGAGLVGRRAPAEALASVEPFSVDTLDFEQWLQWIFLPRMKMILEQDLPLPNASGIQEMAEMVYAESAAVANAQRVRCADQLR